MTTSPKYEELTRKMHDLGKELLGYAKEAEMNEGFAHITVGPKDDYIRVDMSGDDGTYEICTFGKDEKPRLSFREA